MTMRQLKAERMRLLILMLFYKNDEIDYQIYCKSIKMINKEIERSKTYKKEFSQIEFFISKTINENTPENRERLKKLIENELLAKARA